MSLDETGNFHDLIDALDAGQASAQLTRKMKEIVAENVERARDTGKAKGTLTLELVFNTAGQNGQTTIGYSIKSKPAPHPTAQTVLYGSDKGTMTARDPRQQPLKFATKGPVS